MFPNKWIQFEMVAIIKCLQQDNVTFLWYITECWKSNNSPQMSNNSPKKRKNIITHSNLLPNLDNFLPQKGMLMIVTIHFQCTERSNKNEWRPRMSFYQLLLLCSTTESHTHVEQHKLMAVFIFLWTFSLNTWFLNSNSNYIKQIWQLSVSNHNELPTWTVL